VSFIGTGINKYIGALMKNTASHARLKASLEELARFGCPVDLSVAATGVENERVEIRQVGGIHESYIFELEDGYVGCMANISVANQRTRTIDVMDVELRAPWDDSLFEWLTPLRVKSDRRAKRGCSHSVYQFPGEHGLQFEYGEVINHFLLDSRKLPGKRLLEGWLLGIGGLMPANLHHGQWFDMLFTIVASDQVEYSTTMSLWTERITARSRILKTRTRIFPTLMEEAIPIGEVLPTRDATDIPLPPHRLPESDGT
jgi:hypothetical protein